MDQQDGHGQHGHGRILINDAAKQRNPTSYRGYFFLKVAIDRGPGPLSIAGLEKKYKPAHGHGPGHGQKAGKMNFGAN